MLAVLAVAISILASSAAYGQDASGVFVDGVLFAGVERHSHTDYREPVDTTDDLSRVVPGGGFAVGTGLSPRVSVRVEGAWRGEASVTYPSPLVEQAPGNTFTTYERSYRAQALSVLGGYHPSSRGAIRFGYLAGIAFVREVGRQQSISVFPGLPPIVQPSTERADATAIAYRLAATLGWEADVAVSSRVHVVPFVRLLGHVGVLSIRPGIAARLGF